eukprot:CAMPEP_0115005968 /NCGR_PEP_ID=MMETSP0216-20121206/20204_1 /TAXON_ID=223996 /ORGANISM="Protocruzia adherens, Strain Boccale" /LENGTH=73 /DNA_ID=CAMNT_0002372429 /DNA_START=43 /DNA_END=264 /DNA_ORIENTATION=-
MSGLVLKRLTILGTVCLVAGIILLILGLVGVGDGSTDDVFHGGSGSGDSDDVEIPASVSYFSNSITSLAGYFV